MRTPPREADAAQEPDKAVSLRLVEEAPGVQGGSIEASIGSMISHSKPCIDASDHQAVHDVLASGMIARGERVRQFEAAVATHSIPPTTITEINQPNVSLG